MRLLGKGKRELSRHKEKKALVDFQQALGMCPVEEKQDLSQILLYLGITLLKLGFAGIAIRTWTSGARLYKTGPCVKMLNRFSNDYGMCRDEEIESDFRAFQSIHLRRYLRSRGNQRFGSPAEKDMVNDIIFSAWEVLNETVELSVLSATRKIALFKKTIVVFPYLECPEDWSCEEIFYDFRKNTVVSADSSCSCGSGRANMTCCGRLLSEDELESGLF